MKVISEFFSMYGKELLYSIYTLVLAGISYIGYKIKKIVKNFDIEQQKKRIVEDSVRYVDQVYKNSEGEKKYAIAEENIKILLKQNNITVTDLELKVLIESACHKFCPKCSQQQ